MQTVVINSERNIEIPNEVMQELGIEVGDKVCFIKKDGDIILKSSQKNVLKELQKLCEGLADEAGWKTTDEIDDYMKEIRVEYEAERKM